MQFKQEIEDDEDEFGSIGYYFQTPILIILLGYKIKL
jgi:hypothetical protein